VIDTGNRRDGAPAENQETARVLDDRKMTTHGFLRPNPVRSESHSPNRSTRDTEQRRPSSPHSCEHRDRCPPAQ
jgi:hypothetical protein